MYDTTSGQDGDCALYVPCSQVQLARVVVCVLVLDDVFCVMLVVLIARVDVVHAVDTIFVAIFCSGRCTLYTMRLLKFMQLIVGLLHMTLVSLRLSVSTELSRVYSMK